MKREAIVWREKYRPKTVKECILPERLKATFQKYVDDKAIPDLLLYGGAGVGKTTIAKALCNEVGCDYIVINGSEDNGIDVLRTTIRSYASTMSMSGGRKVIIVDEADYMNANSLQPALRSALEEFTKNCSFIFTCNNVKRIIDPLRGRFPEIEFKLKSTEKVDMAKQFLKKVEEILVLENITYKREVLIEFIKKYFPNYRKILTELQRYSVNGSVDEGILAQIVDVDIKDLVGFLKDKDFSKVKKWTVLNTDNDPNSIYRQIYDGISKYVKPETVPAVILILAKYQYQSAFACDAEIQLLACLTEIMLESVFV
jgi:DNA polymerase III delta prime subunit